VGTAAVQLAAAAGAWVTATVRSEELREGVADIGSAVGWTEVVAPDAFTEHGPFDVILELVGAPNFGADLGALATCGRLSIIGIGAGAVAEINLGALMGKRARIHGSTLRARPLEEKADAARRVERHVLPLLEAGDVRVPVDCTFPLDEVDAAYDRFAAGGKLGKIVLILD
jgi:NADPH:quinone reductase-like Zn-dependent oxidoreductase